MQPTDKHIAPSFAAHTSIAATGPRARVNTPLLITGSLAPWLLECTGCIRIRAVYIDSRAAALHARGLGSTEMLSMRQNQYHR